MGISDIVWSMIMASPVQCSSKMLCTLPAHEGDTGPGLEDWSLDEPMGGMWE